MKAPRRFLYLLRAFFLPISFWAAGLAGGGGARQAPSRDVRGEEDLLPDYFRISRKRAFWVSWSHLPGLGREYFSLKAWRAARDPRPQIPSMAPR